VTCVWADEAEPGYWEWASSSDLVRVAWRVVVDRDGTWTTGGSEFWGLAFTRFPDGVHLAQVVGPSLEPRTMTLRAGEVTWGVDLRPHVFWRGLAKTSVVDEMRDLPTERVGDGWWFELGGVRLPLPAVAELDAAVESLRENGLLVAEPLVGAVLAGADVDVPDRTVRRRFQATTGLRRGQVDRVRRARAAYALLTAGAGLAEAAAAAGFADQAHMTRELRRLAGATPARLLHEDTTSF
jgi:hypothetical protein